jgi:peptide/nickel transport system substrate-binding protein
MGYTKTEFLSDRRRMTWAICGIGACVIVLSLLWHLTSGAADQNSQAIRSPVANPDGSVPPPSDPSSPEAKQGDWLVIRFGSEPRTLNPVTSKDAYASRIQDFIFDTLIDRDLDTLEYSGEMAESWTISDDKLTITFKLRKGMLWSDGQPVTAEDIVFSYDTVMDKTVDAQRIAGYFKDVKKVEALDDRTVRFTFSKPYFKSLEVSGAGYMTYIPKHVYAYGKGKPYADGQAFSAIRDKLVGCGPYVFESWTPGQQIVLRRNEHYYGTPGSFDKIVFRIVPDDTAALQMVKAQELDYMSLSSDQYLRVEHDKRFNENYKRLLYAAPSGYMYIAWNNKHPIFKDRRVRVALTHLVPRKLMAERLLNGLVDVATGPFWPGGKGVDVPLQCDRTVKPYPYDPIRALAMLADAGWADTDGDGVLDKNGMAFRFQILIPSGSETGMDIASATKEVMGKVGIRVDISQLEWTVFVGKLDDRNYDAIMLSWTGGVEGDPYQIWHSSSIENKGSNHVSFNNPEADRLIEAARVEFDREKRNALYHQFHRLLHREQPYTFLFSSRQRKAVHKRLDGVRIHVLGLNPEEWWTPRGRRRYGN